MDTTDPVLIILEFWEACVHQILYARRVYPALIFVQRSLYGVNVWQSVHPQVNDYIHRVLQNAKVLLDAGLVERLVVVLRDATKPQQSPPLEAYTLYCNFVPKADIQMGHLSGDSLDQLEREFGAMILKLTLVGLPVPSTTSFSLLLITRDCDDENDQGGGVKRPALTAALRTNNWIVENTQLPEAQSPTHVVPIKSFQAVSFVNSISITNMSFDSS